MLTAIKFYLFGECNPSLSAFLWNRFWACPSDTRRETFWLFLARRA